MPITFKVSVTPSSFLSYSATFLLCHLDTHPTTLQELFSYDYNHPKRSKKYIAPGLVHLQGQWRETATPGKCNTLPPEGIFFCLLKRQAGRQTLTLDIKVSNAKLWWVHALIIRKQTHVVPGQFSPGGESTMWKKKKDCCNEGSKWFSQTTMHRKGNVPLFQET